MNDVGEKFVDYMKYCYRCKHIAVPPGAEPCNECLTEPVNVYSSKPINWEQGNVNENRRD